MWYSDIFAKTPVGKLIGSTLMTLGPSMAAATLNGPNVAIQHAQSATRQENTQEQMLATLNLILEEVRAKENAAASRP